MSALETVIKKVSGRAVSVPGNDVDTDRIMPARYLKCVTFENIGQYLFQDERFDPSTGKPKNHPLNESKHKGASILVVNKNFGCGSSREHAPQGILRYGFKAIIGESFAEIFAGNCTAIGLPAVTAPETDVKNLQAFVRAEPDAVVTVDLEQRKVVYGDFEFAVDVREASRRMFLEGTWDTSAMLLSARDEIRKTSEKIPYLSWLRS
jgi:3-isopropylmalate/(R)-2-methylmalate dehydratase small subunit